MMNPFGGPLEYKPTPPADRVNTPEEAAMVEEFFQSLEPSECLRLYIFFMRQAGVEINERDWKDRSTDGNLKAPPGAMSAGTGK